MNQTEAFAILEIPSDAGSRGRDMAYITKAYRLASLKHHPDKNENSPESTARFQKINEAYHYLSSNINASSSIPPQSFAGAVSYQEIFVFFIRTMFARNGNGDVNVSDIETALMHIVSSNYDKLLKTLDKSTAIAVYEFMHEYADVLHLPEDTLEKMFKIVSDKMKSDNLVILNPSLSDVFQKKVYDLEYESKRFTVPLWHNEVYYPLTNDSDLVVRCNICDVPEYMYIDENNHIVLSVRTSIQRLLDTGSVTVTIPLTDQPSVEIKIPSHALVITTASQLYVCPDLSIGIPKINTRAPLDASVLAGISVRVELY
jgi:hypothetical protein